jgi:hypothetical protein
MTDEDKTKDQLILELVVLRQVLHKLTSLDQSQAQNTCLPICSQCKKVRDEKEEWQQIERYLHRHYGIDFTHGYCPDCLSHQYLELEKFGALSASL